MKLGTQVLWTLQFMLIKNFCNLKFSVFLNFADGFVISSKVCLQLGARKPVTKHISAISPFFLLLEMHFHEKCHQFQQQTTTTRHQEAHGCGCGPAPWPLALAPPMALDYDRGRWPSK